MRRTSTVLLAASLASALLPALPAATAPATEVVVDGLRNPRGITAAGVGAVYVAEAGSGPAADDPSPACITPDPEFTLCYGDTGRVSVIDTTTGDRTDVVAGLPSAGSAPDDPTHGFFATGPHDVLATGPDLFVPVGLGDVIEARDSLADEDPGAEGLGQLWKINTVGPSATTLADIVAFETAENPDGGTDQEGNPSLDSNPHGVASGGPDDVIVVDAGGNGLLRVDRDTGATSSEAVIPPFFQELPRFFGAPPGTGFPADPVPTSAARNSDGTFTVGELSGFPFSAGASRIMNVDGGDVEVFLDGNTHVMDLTWGPDGNLYVLEFTNDSLLVAEEAFFGGNPDQAPPGQVVRVLEDGTREVVLADPLIAPAGLAFGADDQLYITNCSICPETGEMQGHVLRFDAVAADPLLSVRNDVTATTEDEQVVVDVLENDSEGAEMTGIVDEGIGSATEGSVVYQPAAHFVGQDQVRYRVCGTDGACSTGVLDVTVSETATDRLAGDTRIETAVEISRAMFPEGADAVIIARSDKYPDALAGAVLAKQLGAPILLTPTDRLDPATAEEARRLGASVAYILGKEAAISGETEVLIRERTGVAQTKRIGGLNRFETAKLIKDELESETGEPATQVYIAEGLDLDETRGFPDVLSAATLAAHQGRPILLVTTEQTPEATLVALEGVDEAVIVGGPVAVNTDVEARIRSAVEAVSRVAGEDRYETSSKVAALMVQKGLDPKLLFLATGQNWPDALVAGAAVAKDGGVLVLVHPDDLGRSPETADFVRDNRPFTDIDLLGGPKAITDQVEDQIAALAG